MKTTQTIHIQKAGRLVEVRDESVHLVVTSPPYPMIRMWDEVFSSLNPEIETALAEENAKKAFNLMHAELDETWEALWRVVKDGGFVCINIGDATRKLGGVFELHPNAARITSKMRALGFHPLPPIIWKKTTNAPNKFMGSGMLPGGAYVTLEHEHILVFRKGGMRVFDEEEKKRRKASAYFYEERNRWFTNVWDIRGVRQMTKNGELRKRSAAFPLEIPLRLIHMHSIKGDTVLDPFLGTGSTLYAAALSGRNAIAYEIDETLLNGLESRLFDLPVESLLYMNDRLNDHQNFLRKREKKATHFNPHLKTQIVTKQEEGIRFHTVQKVEKQGKYRYIIDYE